MLRSLLAFFIAGIFVLAPSAAFAADANFFGPIIPDGTNNQPDCRCPESAPDWGCVLQTFQNLINFVISMSVIIVTLVAAYAGILLISSPFNAENKSKARSMLMSSVIGLVIVISAWLIVDFVMKALYSPGAAQKGLDTPDALPWNAILGEGAGTTSHCLDQTETPTGDWSQPSDTTTPGTGTGSQAPGGLQPSGTAPDGQFTYQGNISAQKSHASSKLNTLLSCMANKVPGNIGQISSISDGLIVSGTKTFAQCAAGECVHKENSCHYGGKTCVGKSYAVDFGDGGRDNAATSAKLEQAARDCGASLVLREGNHLHVSVGEDCNCDGNDGGD